MPKQDKNLAGVCSGPVQLAMSYRICNCQTYQEIVKNNGLMPEQSGAPAFVLYLDDSGTRCPFRPSRQAGDGMDWFALGGLLLKSEDLTGLESAHRLVCDPDRADAFLSDLEATICALPAHVIACVVHRSGYNKRYGQKYGEQRWSLCKTAYRIAVERAAKISEEADRRLLVHIERTGKREDALIREYHSNMLTKDSYFDPNTSQKYAPMSRESLERVLMKSPEFFTKDSLIGQLSDLVLYPVVRGRYEPNYAPFVALKKSGRLIDSLFQADEIEYRGIKYSCFDGI